MASPSPAANMPLTGQVLPQAELQAGRPGRCSGPGGARQQQLLLQLHGETPTTSLCTVSRGVQQCWVAGSQPCTFAVRAPAAQCQSCNSRRPEGAGRLLMGATCWAPC